MRRRQGQASIVASPVLVGAVTLLVTIIAVFIAYNANAGLPFVPTYDIKAQIPTGAKLVAGNEVRIGGFRVGVVEDIQPETVEENGETKSIAVLSMKIDKTASPISADSTIKVRPRSALGLKFVEIVPGRSQQELEAGATLALKQSSESLELEDIFSTFDTPTRENARTATAGFGDAFAGRGQSLNEAIGAFNPFFKSLLPVARNLANPRTGLDQFFRQLGATAAQVAPVAETQAALFGNMATTFGALSESPAALAATIEKSPGTLQTGIESLAVQRPFLADFAELSADLRPAVRELRSGLPAINKAITAGIPTVPLTVPFNEDLEKTLDASDKLFSNPNTILALRDLRTTLRVTTPAVQFISPYQTVCNYATFFFGALSDHWSGPSVLGGTVQNQGLKLVNMFQHNSLGNSESARPWDLNPGVDPIGASDGLMPLGRAFGTPYTPAIDAQGNADCQLGQSGYPKGPDAPNIRYKPGLLPDGNPTGGNAAVTNSNYPILSGPTYISQKLGIKNLSDVDKLRTP
jgi:virulence factor Mce-like protein